MEKITNQIKFIGGTLSLIIIAILFSILHINQKGKTDSNVINIAGKQRMITQKITKEVFYLSTSDSISSLTLEQSIKGFDKNLKDLIDGNEKKGIYKPPTKLVKEQLNSLKESWLPFKESVLLFKDLMGKIKNERKFVYEQNILLLRLSDNIVKEMVKSGVEGKYIDLSGQQRMLSQRMMFQLLLYLNSSNPKYYSEFFTIYTLYGNTIKSFATDKELTQIKKLKSAIDKNMNFWSRYSVEAKNLIELQSRVNKITTYIQNSNISLLNTADQVVSIYSTYCQTQRALIEKIEYILGIIALLIMLYSAVLTKKIEKHFGEFLSHSKILTSFMPNVVDRPTVVNKCGNNELIEANSHLKTFIASVDEMILDAQKALQSSEKITNELSNIADVIDRDIEKLNLEEKHKKDLINFVDNSEDLAIQSIEELKNSERLLQKLHENLHIILEKAK